MKSAILILAALLSGCSLMPSSFDSALYDHVVAISVDADRAQSLCGTPAMHDAVIALNRESKLALTYSTYTAKDTHDAIAVVDKAITEMDAVYALGTPTNGYCTLKLGVIGLDADIVLTGLGGKSR
jgi:hypothetical protein